jgi:hypothetical protein
MRTVRVPLTAVSRDSADHPCGNCAAVYLGRIITIAYTVLISTVFPEQFLGRRRRMTGQPPAEFEPLYSFGISAAV